MNSARIKGAPVFLRLVGLRVNVGQEPIAELQVFDQDRFGGLRLVHPKVVKSVGSVAIPHLIPKPDTDRWIG